MPTTIAAPPKLITISDICRALGERNHRVRYAINEYNIQPLQRAGIIRLFHPDDVERVRSALRRIDSSKGAA